MTTARSPSFSFSPSNVKRILGGGSSVDYFPPTTTKVYTTPSSLSSAMTLTSSKFQGHGVKLFSPSATASIAKKSNIGRSSSRQQQPRDTDDNLITPAEFDLRLDDHKYGNRYNTSPSLSSHMMERIGKALVGKEILGDVGEDFEHSLRLKKACVEELKYAHFLLLIGETKQRAVDTREHLQSGELSPKDVSNQSHLQEVAAVAQEIGSASFPSEVKNQNADRGDTQKITIDMQLGTDDSNTRVKISDKYVLALKQGEPNLSLKDQTIKLSSDVTAASDTSKGHDRSISDLHTRISRLIAESATERASFSVRDASHAEQVRAFEERLLSEEQMVFESKKNHAAIVTTLEQRNTVIEADRDDARLELEKARLAMVNARNDADATLTAMDEERLSFHHHEETLVKQVSSLEELVEAKQQKVDDSAKSLTAMESDRDVALQDLERERLALAVLAAESAIRQVSSSQRDTSHAEQVRVLEERLVAKENVESDREVATRELEKGRLALSCAEAVRDELKTELDKAQVAIALLELEKSEAVSKSLSLEDIIVKLQKETHDTNSKNSQLMIEIKECTTKHDAIESEKRECTNKLERIACEKEEADAHLRESNDQLARLEEQVLATNSKNSQLMIEIEEFTAKYEAAESEKRECAHKMERVVCEKEEAEAQLKESNDKLQREITSLKDSESKLNNSIKELENEREIYQLNLVKLEAASKSADAERTELIVCIRRLELEISENQIQVQSLSSALKAAHEELSLLKCNRLQLDDLITDLKSDFNLSKAKSEEDRELFQRITCTLNDDILSLKSNLLAAEKETANVQATVQALTVDLVTKEHDLVCLQQVSSAEKESLKIDLESKSAELAALQSSQKSLTDHMNDLAKKLEATKSDAVNQNANLMAELKQLSQQLIESDNDTQQYKSICTDLKYKLETAEALLDEGDAEIQSLNEVSERLDKMVIDLQALLKNADDDVSNLKGEFESLAIEKESMACLMQSEIDALRERERYLISQLKITQELQDCSHNDIQTKLAESQDDAIQSKALVSDLRSKLESADNSLVEANVNVQSLIRDCSCWEKQANDLGVSFVNANEANTKKNDEVESLTVELTDLRRQQDSKVSTLEKDIAELNLSLKIKEVENASLLSQLREWKTTFDDLTTGLRQAEAQCQSQTESHELKQDELILRNNDLTVSVENLSAHVQHIEAKLRRDKLQHEVSQGKLLNDIRDLQNVVAGNNIKCIHLANELEADNSEYLKCVREKDLELETMTLAIESKDHEICRLKNAVSSANQSITLLKSEGNATVGALVTELNNARKSLEEERESLNDRIKTLQRELNESVDALQQQKERIAKNEAMHASDLESWHKKLSEANEREHDVREQANELKDMLNARQVKFDRLVVELHSATSDHEESVSAMANAHRLNIERMRCAHDNKINELEERIFEFSGKLRQREVEVDQLQQKLQEGMELYSSLREYGDEKERKVHELLAEIELLETKINLIAQSMSKVKSEKQRLNDELNIKDAAIELQNLATIKAVEESNQSEMRLQSKLEATRSGLVQISMDLADTREVAAKAIEDSKNDAKKVVQRVVNTFKASQSKSESGIRKLLQAKKQVHEELSTKDDEIKSLATMRSLLVSENAEMKCTIQQQEELLSQLNHNHENRLSKLNEKLQIATINWAHEKSSHESKMQSLQDVINEKCLLNRSLLARVEVASILAQRDDKFGKMFDAVGMMKDACDDYCAVDFSQDSEMDELRITSVSREKLIEMLSVDLTLAQDEIVSLKAEVECAKATSQCKIMSLREEYSEKLSALIDDMTKGRASIESDWRSFQSALRQVAVCIAHEDQELPIEALPEMTALLTTFFELFQQKVDQISSLQSQLQNFIMNGNHLHETSDLVSGSRHDLAVYDLMSEIKVANQMMEEMSRKSDSEASYRTMTEIKCKAGVTSLLDATERITTLEHQIREMEEHALVQSTKIKDLENYIDATRHQFNKKSKEAKDMEMHLEHAETQKRKLELQYERSLAEIESSKKHSVDLTTMIIEKVSLLEF